MDLTPLGSHPVHVEHHQNTDHDSDVNISVIIPCFRAVRFLPIQLLALANQVGAPRFEVILADNGDNNGLRDVVSVWSRHLPLLRVVDATAQRGAGFARNQGAAASVGKILLFCDADDAVAPDWVTEAEDVLSDYAMFSGAATPVPVEVFQRGYEAVIEGITPAPEPGNVVRSGTPSYPLLMGGNSGFRRSLYFKLGGYDTAFASLAEDNDLAFRTHRAGTPVVNAPRVRIAYRFRNPSERTIRRGFAEGLAHARLCSKHDAWLDSPSYHSRLWQEPFKALAAGVRSAFRKSAAHARWRSRLGVSLGLIWGWLATPTNVRRRLTTRP